MHCKGCENEIVGEQFRLVAEWPFCIGCFDGLRNAAAQPRVDPKGGAPLALVSAPRTEAVACCAACDRQLGAGELKQLGSLNMCAACHASLIAEPFKALLEREQAEATARAQAKQTEVRVPLSRAEVFEVGVAGKKLCARCSRRLIEPGGYKTLDGQHFCPACAHAVDADRAAAASAPPRTPPTSSTNGADAPPLPHASCEACERSFAGTAPESIEGFFFCRPCTRLDLGSALTIARARHRARLLKLRGDFGEHV